MNAPEPGIVCIRAAIRCHTGTVLLTLVAILAATPCSAYDVMLRWTVPPEPGIVGYRVYSGQASGMYAPPIDVGRADNSTLSGVVYYLSQNLALGIANYVAVTAYDSRGAESDYSNERMFDLLAATPPSVDAGPDQGATVGTPVRLGATATAGVNYFWDETAGPAATLTSQTTSSTQFTPQTPGAYTFALTAYDAQGIAAQDTVTVIVTAGPTTTPAFTVTPQGTPVPTNSRTATPKASVTATRTAVATNTPTRTATPTRTRTPTRTATPTPTPQGSNDVCSNAVAVGAAPYSGTVTTTSATSAAGDPPVGCGNGSRAKSVWYRFTPPASGTLTANTFGSNYDTILAAYTGSCAAFTAVPAACNDDSSGRQSSVSFTATAGTTYYFLVSAYSGNGGSLVFQLTFQGAARTATPSPTRTRTPSPTTTSESAPR